MRAMRLSDSTDLSALVEDNIPKPQPGRGEILIRIFAAGVTSKELIWYPTTHNKNGEARKRAVPCHEFSGVVADVGEVVEDFDIGQDVYGMNDWFAEGALAEFCLTQPNRIAPKPAKLTHAEAASVPVSAVTAWQGLFDRARRQAGERVLVHGSAGGVGSFAIQLARRHGAHVTSTASARNFDFVKALGAERIIDYHESRFEAGVSEVDVVLDTVGGETLQRSWSVLAPGGRIITVAASSEAPADDRAKQAFFIVEPNRKQLNPDRSHARCGRFPYVRGRGAAARGGLNGLHGDGKTAARARQAGRRRGAERKRPLRSGTHFKFSTVGCE